MKNIVLYGSPACGKGTQSKILRDRLKMVIIEAGSLLRKEIDNGTEMGKVISSYIDNGNLAPNEITNQLIRDNYDAKFSTGYIFDGYPRTKNQVDELDNLLESLETQVDIAIIFEMSDELIYERVESRISEGRVDDQSKDKVLKRIEHYKKNKDAIIEHYEKQNKAVFIDASKSVEDVYSDILDSIYNKIILEIDKVV